jgi:hypothetical protein
MPHMTALRLNHLRSQVRMVGTHTSVQDSSSPHSKAAPKAHWRQPVLRHDVQRTSPRSSMAERRMVALVAGSREAESMMFITAPACSVHDPGSATLCVCLRSRPEGACPEVFGKPQPTVRQRSMVMLGFACVLFLEWAKSGVPFFLNCRTICVLGLISSFSPFPFILLCCTPAVHSHL